LVLIVVGHGPRFNSKYNVNAASTAALRQSVVLSESSLESN